MTKIDAPHPSIDSSGLLHEMVKALANVRIPLLQSDLAMKFELAPIPMVLMCPNCGKQHIDEATPDWPNPTHRSHLCLFCGTIWRPADVATTGVACCKTRGRADNWHFGVTEIEVE